MRTLVRRWRDWLLFILCLLSAGLELARAEGPSPAPGVRGLSAGAGLRPTPLADRPPGALPEDGGPSPVIFPPESIAIRFNHRRHVKDLNLSCVACHQKVPESRRSSDRLLPEPAACDRCHASDHRDLSRVLAAPDQLIAQCGFCHLGYRSEQGNRVRRTVLREPNLVFSHRAHAERNIGCAQCHGAVQRLELATRDQLPRMRGCFSCHARAGAARGEASGECATCHLTEGSRLQTQLGSEKLLPPRWLNDAQHDADFLIRHRTVAANDSRFCANCHSEKFCADCHDGRVRPRQVHPNDFLSMHPVAARGDRPRCSSCHQKQTFCLTCHQRSGVAEVSPLGAIGERGRFHPPRRVWTDLPRTAAHHAWEAQRNLNACISCHVERDCASCHATSAVRGVGGGLPADMGRGLDPHPLGFRARCRGALRKNARPCLVCHDPADSKLLECR